MKVILTGTKHPEETELEVILDYNGEDTWTFQISKINFTISDLHEAIDFLNPTPKGDTDDNK